MRPDTWRVVSGIAVLVMGIVAGLAVGSDAAEPAAVSSIPAVDTATASVPSAPIPEISGVPPSVTLVLAWGGNAGFADAAATSQLPPAVLSALVASGVPLAIPEAETP